MQERSESVNSDLNNMRGKLLMKEYGNTGMIVAGKRRICTIPRKTFFYFGIPVCIEYCNKDPGNEYGLIKTKTTVMNNHYCGYPDQTADRDFSGNPERGEHDKSGEYAYVRSL